jgi:hypothetical protein
VSSGAISDKITETLITDEILADLGLVSLRLKAEIYDWELITVRTEGKKIICVAILFMGIYTPCT